MPKGSQSRKRGGKGDLEGKDEKKEHPPFNEGKRKERRTRPEYLEKREVHLKPLK